MINIGTHQPNKRIIEYICEEVRRQGHSLKTADDGIIRVAWMWEAWHYAKRIWQQSHGRERPSFFTIVKLGRLVEQEANAEGLRTCGVRVGPRVCPEPQLVPTLLTRLCDKGADLSPLEFYMEFEMIHPFVDGNGRTGKIILNWLNGTLDEPIFPPADFWGPTIANP